jgi:hypothetical protein
MMEQLRQHVDDLRILPPGFFRPGRTMLVASTGCSSHQYLKKSSQHRGHAWFTKRSAIRGCEKSAAAEKAQGKRLLHTDSSALTGLVE